MMRYWRNRRALRILGHAKHYLWNRCHRNGVVEAIHIVTAAILELEFPDFQPRF
jgi:hypothetical protein